MDYLTEMLRNQLEFQRRLGHNFSDMTETERITHLKNMFIAAVAELVEALDEITWKPWVDGPARINRAALCSELNDTFQFIMNMWFAAMPNLGPEDIATVMKNMHDTKLKINHARKTDGYDGHSTKCPICGRATDDPNVECRIGKKNNDGRRVFICAQSTGELTGSIRA